MKFGFRKPTVVTQGNQVISCQHEHWKPWRDGIWVVTTTCDSFDCSAHTTHVLLYGRQCITPGCGNTWRVTASGKPLNIPWRESNGTEHN